MLRQKLIAAAASLPFLLVIAGYSQDKPRVDRDALAARGAVLADQDPLASDLRDSLLGEGARNGFYIGMALAEGHTAPGPGKDGICNSLLRTEPEGCNLAVLFSVERNRHSTLRTRGVELADADPAVAKARSDASASARFRRPSDLIFFLLGFDIGLGIAEGHTAPGPGKDAKGRDLLHPSEQAGYKQAVSFSVEHNRRSAAESSSGTTANPSPDRVDRPSLGTTAGPSSDRVVSTEIRCRGYSRPGGGAYVFFTINSRSGSAGETLVTYEIAFTPATRAAGARGEGLQPGNCAYVDRPIAASGPYRIRFETVANAQLKQALHGSAVDRSTTAAESYPDVNTIPIYLKGENHYWSFGGVTDTGRGYFLARGNGYWKPSVAIDNLPAASPTAPPRRRTYP